MKDPIRLAGVVLLLVAAALGFWLSMLVGESLTRDPALAESLLLFATCFAAWNGLALSCLGRALFWSDRNKRTAESCLRAGPRGLLKHPSP